MPDTVIELGDLSAPPAPDAAEPRRRWLPAVAVFLALALGAAAVNWALRVPPVRADFADPLPKWSVRLEPSLGGTVRARVVGDRVILTGREGIVALDAATGAKVWSRTTDEADAPWIDVVDGVLFWGVSEPGSATAELSARQALDPVTGRVLYDIFPAGASAYGYATPTAAGVFVVQYRLPGLTVSVLDLRTGAVRWAKELSDETYVDPPRGTVREWQFESVLGGGNYYVYSESEPDESAVALLFLKGRHHSLDLTTGETTPLASDESRFPVWIVGGEFIYGDPDGLVGDGWTYPMDTQTLGQHVPIIVDGKLLNPLENELVDLADGSTALLPGGGATPIAMGQGVVARVDGLKVTGTRFDGAPGWTLDLGPYLPYGHLTDGRKVALMYHYGYSQRVSVIDLATGAHREFTAEALLGYTDGVLLVQRDGAVTAYAA